MMAEWQSVNVGKALEEDESSSPKKNLSKSLGFGVGGARGDGGCARSSSSGKANGG
jgi:hypothetical protein